MGRDKALLPVDSGGLVLIEHIGAQLKPHFEQILISAAAAGSYGDLGFEVVPDRWEDKGPLAGIVSALPRCTHELAFIVACDTPEIRIELIERLYETIGDGDAAVPRSPDGRIEPLYAVYRKSVVARLEEALADGCLKLTEALARIDTRYEPISEHEVPTNLNTRSEYEEFLSRRK